MDIDEVIVNEEALFAYFDLSHGAFPFTREECDRVMSRRQQCGKLFIDELLHQVYEASGDELYPPTSVDGFRNLLRAVDSSSMSRAQKASIPLYFFCHWYPHAAAFATADGATEDEKQLRKFARAHNIAPHYANIVRAYFLLDKEQYESAVHLLADPRIIPDWSSKILATLAAAGIDETGHLILRYIRCAKPTISEPEDIYIYLGALARDNFMDAWLYQRSFVNQDARRECVRQILDTCLIPGHRSDQLKQLAAFPFDALEEETVTAYAAVSEAERRHDLPLRSLAVLRQLLLVRLIQSGRYTDALKADRLMPVPDDDETRIRERRALMRHVLGLVPPIQRLQIEREQLSPAAPRRLPSSASGSWASIGGSDVTTSSSQGMSASMSGSWDDLSASHTSSQAQSTPRRISLSRLQAPASGSPTLNRTNGVDLTPRARLPGPVHTTPSGSRAFAPVPKPPTPHSITRDIQPFYQPSPAPAFTPLRSSGTVTPSKRPLPESPTAPPVATGTNDDIQMLDSDDPDAFVVRPLPSVVLPRKPKTNGVSKPRQPSFSVTAQRDDPMDTEEAIPGAFPGDNEQEESQPASGRRSKRQRHSATEAFDLAPALPAASVQPRKTSTRTTRAKAAPLKAASPPPISLPAPKPAKPAASSTPRRGTRGRRISIPGEFRDDTTNTSESDDDSDGEDATPAQRPTKRGSRKNAARTESIEPEVGRVRRSTRLSVTSSVDSASSPPRELATTVAKKAAGRRKSVEPAAGSSRMATRRSKVITLEEVEE